MKRILPPVLALAAALSAPGAAEARTVSADEAAGAARTWLLRNPDPVGSGLLAPDRPPAARTVSGEDGTPLFHVADLPGGGYVVLSADDGVEPVVAFSASGSLPDDPAHPLRSVLERELAARVRALRTLRSGAPARTGGTPRRKSAAPRAGTPDPAVAANEAAWSALLAGGGRGAARDPRRTSGTAAPPDVRVPVLLATRWGQETSDDRTAFNYYTPNGYPCGCVALCMAQTMRFWEHPASSRPSVTRRCAVDGTPGDFATFGGPYPWSSMPDDPFGADAGGPPTETEREALGRICYDAGVSVCMQWASRASGAAMSDVPDALRDVFGYAGATFHSEWPGSIAPDVVRRLVCSNLDAGSPVLVGIDGSSGGHAVVADGYGYSGDVLYTHLNMGWTGADDAWYHLPDVDCDWYRASVVDEIVYNVHPVQTGEIVSGRVTDPSGTPLAGVSVSASAANRTTVAGRTDGRGIYALRVAGGRTWTVRAERTGRAPASKTVAVPQAASPWDEGGQSAGNAWGVDFELAAVSAVPKPVYRFYSPKANAHFYTMNEKEMLGLKNKTASPNWNYAGIAYYAYDVQVAGTVPLYRFYSPKYGGHFYTISESERETTQNSPNWNDNGIACYVHPKRTEGASPVWRFWSPSAKHHFFTMNETEALGLKNKTTSQNWDYQFVAFYALSRPAQTVAGPPAAVTRSMTLSAAGGTADRDTAAAPAPWTLLAMPDAVPAADGADVLGLTLETLADAPDAAELSAEPAPLDEPAPFRLTLPAGSFASMIWSAAGGVLGEETDEGAFDFELPDAGVWHWLRVRDAAGDDAFSLWLRLAPAN